MRSFKTTANGILDNERTVSGILTAVLIATVLAFNIVIFALANIFTLTFTPDEADEFVLTGNTDALFADAQAEGKKITIYFCFPEKEKILSHDTGKFVLKTAEEYKERYGDFISIEYVNLITGLTAGGENITEKIAKWQTDEKGEKNYLARGSVIFECGESYKVVTDTYTSYAFGDFYTLDASGNIVAYNGEAFMAAMMNWVTVDYHPNAYFTVGHSEQLDRAFANILVSAGYVIDTVDLKEGPVPSDADLLIVSNPISDFEKGIGAQRELERLNDYVKRGGNIYVALDPYVGKLPVLEGFLQEYGIAFSENEEDGQRKMIKDSDNAITADGFTLVANFADNDIAEKIGSTVSKYSEGNVIVRETAMLEVSKGAAPILVSTPDSSLEVNGERVDSEGSYAIAAAAKIKNDNNKIASLFVVSSVYVSVSDSLITNGYSNADFMYSLFDNFYGQSGMPYGCDVVKYDTSILENLTMGKAKIYTALILAIPAAIAIAGAAVVIKRKNR